MRHGLEDLLGQRIYGLVLGYDDANDAARLAADPMHKLLLGRDPVTGDDLASQPTLSRFENGVLRGELLRMSEALFEAVITRHRRRRRKVRRITVDLDVTDDPTHGAQQLSFFNGFYHTWCYLPLLAFLTFDRESEQYLCAAALRPGNASTQRGALPMLKRILQSLQERFPEARILVRLDGGFAEPELFTFLDEVGADYVVGLAKNDVLERRAALDMIAVRAQSLASGQTEHLYTDLTYGAGTWDRERRVILKAEVVQLEGREMRDNPRFVVTNLNGSPRHIYQRLYCQRGEIENRIKELFDVALDRTSCSRFLANAFSLIPLRTKLREAIWLNRAIRWIGQAARGLDRTAAPPSQVHRRAKGMARGRGARSLHLLRRSDPTTPSLRSEPRWVGSGCARYDGAASDIA